MKAYVCRRYGGPEVLELVDLPDPVPKANEILVRIRATTVSSADWRVRTLTMPRGFGPIARPALGFSGPRTQVLGTELAGVVEAVGPDVTRFKCGDEVAAFPGGKMGCHAEYRLLCEDGPVAPKPAGLSFDEAASLFFGATTALHFLRKAHVRRGDKVLVVGASGTVGVAIVQLAKQFGAEVTAVTSTGNCGLVTALGADEVVDYAREDFTGRSERYDIIADTVGTPFARCKKALGKSGRMLAIVAGLPDMLASLWVPLTSRRKIIAGPAGELPEDVRHILDLAAAGRLKPVIDKRYTFSQMAEAHAYVATGRKRGSVVVSVDP